ncbi:pyridoxal-dependent decarboxylase [Methylovorus sp. MM2]|uniref:pyridoxal phosphate-dependent decarboxylase family protein n=1 Tax=Methylovorus sp. MM2 TaxID=1848038 RepID=UPI0007DEB424|nr:aminotransferase class I/II-fold pyridoxal phosphate-dependent enzyme [Methylovorus sp. MM2]OAM51199.1 pyridoxal-dependent decarboxylase [Methylovorus sp. MM2]
MNKTKTLIADMFDPEQFQVIGHHLIDLLTNQLSDQIAGNASVFNWRAPALEDINWQQPLPITATFDAKQLIDKLQTQVLSNNLAIHHPHNLGHQVATPLPIAALCDLVASLTNQAMAVYETGPSATMLERQVIRWLSTLIGWEQSEGVLTSGGAQANLTALLAARQHTAQSNVWKDGIADHQRMCILASEYAHYSVARAAGIMGLGTNAVIKVAADREGRMDIHALEMAYEEAIANRLHIIAVVATAGCTPTGSIDPLMEIGDFCQLHDLWLHVDGAHGASALLSEQHRESLKGIELADSVVWDGHKLLYMPATVSAVIFRERKNAYAAFAQDASYLFQGNTHEEEAYNISYRTLECTKRMMGLKLWVAFSLYGVEGLAALVDHAFLNAAIFAEKLQDAADFELLIKPQTNIVCFRHQPSILELEALNQHQVKLRKDIVESGAFHLTQVEIHGEIWLRTTLMNPFTESKHMDSLIDLISALSSQAK